MRAHSPSHRRLLLRAEHGYSLIELMISVAILSIVAGTVMSGVFKVTQLTETVSNRSEMHSGVRNATEFLQQEIGQAGKVALPNAKGLGAAVAIGTGVTASIVRAGTSTGDVSGIFVNEMLIVGTGDTQETVKVLSVNTASNQITADFFAAHTAASPVTVQGGKFVLDNNAQLTSALTLNGSGSASLNGRVTAPVAVSCIWATNQSSHRLKVLPSICTRYPERMLGQ